MMTRKIVALIAGACTIAISLPTLAVEARPSGFYADGTFGYGQVNETVKGSTETQNAGAAWNVNFGYKFTRYLATEIGYYNYSNEDFDPVAQGQENLSLAFALKGIIPLKGGFSLFGKVGLAGTHHRLHPWADYVVSGAGRHTRLTPLGAAGVAYAFSESTQVIGQFAGTPSSGSVPAMYQGGIGLAYIFY